MAKIFVKKYSEHQLYRTNRHTQT